MKGEKSSAAISSGIDREEIEDIVEDYLTNNPDKIVTAFITAREAQEAQQIRNAEQAIDDRRKDLERDPGTPLCWQ